MRRLVNILVSVLIWNCMKTPNCHGGMPEVRGSSRDAVNAAWLLASLSRDPERDQVIPMPLSEMSHESTFDRIKSLSDAWGLTTDICRLTFSDLSSLHRPCVVLLRHGPQETGYFAVVLDAGPGTVTAINAGWMTVATFSEDEFRLRWTGHALVPRRDVQFSPARVMPFFVLGVICPLMLLPRLKLGKRRLC